MVAEQPLTGTNSTLISPRRKVESAVLGEGSFKADFITDFFPEAVVAKAKVIIAELVNNVIENLGPGKSKFVVNVKAADGMMTIRVKNAVEEWQYDKVKAHLRMIRTYSDAAKLLSDLSDYRRSQGLKGGLGLIRLASECGADLSVAFDRDTSFMTVTAKYPLGE